MKKLIILVIILLFVNQVDAQYSNRWKRYRYEVVYGVGVTNFLGELGGADKEGSNFLRDFEFSMTRPAASLGLRYKILEKLSTKATLSYGVLRGDDKATQEPIRKNRNLNFYAHLVEFSGQFEYSIIREKVGHRYNLRRVRGLKGFKLNTYLFAGVAGFWFNPYGKHPDNDEWIALQPLGTEGQGMPGVGSREKYSRLQVAIPFGVGFKYGLNRVWSIGIEIGVRKTFTDYIDDVSTTYYDFSLQDWSPDVALAQRMGDPSLGEIEGQTSANQQRGDPTDNDTYMFLMITLNYKLKTTRKGLPKFGMRRR